MTTLMLGLVLVPLTLKTKAVLWAAFLAGEGLNVLVRSGMAVRGANGIATRRQYVYLFWDVLIYRGAVGAGLFWAAVSYPQLLSSVGMDPSALNVPIVGPVALFAGLGIDLVLGWAAQKIPFLRKELPPVPLEQAAAAGAGQPS